MAAVVVVVKGKCWNERNTLINYANYVSYLRSWIRRLSSRVRSELDADRSARCTRASTSGPGRYGRRGNTVGSIDWGLRTFFWFLNEELCIGKDRLPGHCFERMIETNMRFVKPESGG